MNEVTRVVFKALTKGDLKKFQAKSNNAKSGGGARDLRFRPYRKFDDAFERLFPEEIKVRRRRKKKRIKVSVRRGTFRWMDSETDEVQSKAAQFEPPTTARGGEGRLVRVNRYPTLKTNFPSGEGQLLFLMVQDAEGEVWPHIVTEHSLRTDKEWAPEVAQAILKCLDGKGARRGTAQGYIDITTGARYCND